MTRATSRLTWPRIIIIKLEKPAKCRHETAKGQSGSDLLKAELVAAPAERQRHGRERNGIADRQPIGQRQGPPRIEPRGFQAA